jgi:hypothetical protein
MCRDGAGQLTSDASFWPGVTVALLICRWVMPSRPPETAAFWHLNAVFFSTSLKFKKIGRMWLYTMTLVDDNVAFETI